MKLKTLKDLNINGMLYDSNGTASGADKINRLLKAEAIKWVKHYRESAVFGKVSHGRVSLMIMFFNITEEDLQ